MSKANKKKDHRRHRLEDDPVKTRTLMNHKKVKEQKKKMMKKRSEARRKRSLGQLMMKNSRSKENYDAKRRLDDFIDSI